MDINKICTACNIKIDKHNYRKWTIVCGGCYNKNKRMYHIEKQSPNNNENVMYESNNNRTFIIGFSNCGKTILINDIFSRNQHQIYIITKVNKPVSPKL